MTTLTKRLESLQDPDHRTTMTTGVWFRITCGCGSFTRTEPTRPAAMRAGIGHLESLQPVAEQIEATTPSAYACAGCDQATETLHSVSLSLTYAKVDLGSHLGTIHLCEKCQADLADPHSAVFDFSKTHAMRARAATERSAFVAKVRLAMHRLAAEVAQYQLARAIEDERAAREKARLR